MSTPTPKHYFTVYFDVDLNEWVIDQNLLRSVYDGNEFRNPETVFEKELDVELNKVLTASLNEINRMINGDKA